MKTKTNVRIGVSILSGAIFLFLKWLSDKYLFVEDIKWRSYMFEFVFFTLLCFFVLIPLNDKERTKRENDGADSRL